MGGALRVGARPEVAAGGLRVTGAEAAYHLLFVCGRRMGAQKAHGQRLMVLGLAWVGFWIWESPTNCSAVQRQY